MGKFYELYHMDAEVAVKELGLIFMKVNKTFKNYQQNVWRLNTRLLFLVNETLIYMYMVFTINGFICNILNSFPLSSVMISQP